jgi:membrane fusion protein, multidrug efflux system
MHFRPPVLLAAIFGLALLVSSSACDKGADSAASKQRLPPLVLIAKPTARDVPVEVRAPVVLKPAVEVHVGARSVAYIDAVLVDRGDRVRRGQVLARLRPSELRDDREGANRRLELARATLKQAELDRDRVMKLVASGAVSAQQAEFAQTYATQARANVDAAEAALASLSTRLTETELTSPIDGVVTQRLVDAGALVGPTTPAIVTVAQVAHLRAFVAVREAQTGRIRIGQKAALTVDAWPGETFWGEVVRISPALDAVTRTLDVEVRLPNTDGRLAAGAYGRAAIVTDTHTGALTVPVQAVRVGEKKASVFRIETAGDVAKARLQPVRVGVDGLMHDGLEWLEIVEGIGTGTDIVIAGADGLSDNMTVRTRREGEPTAPAGSR